ncbi:MAG: hypothetical protein R2684_12075 [Pyrinomonadaceae bacterium]
MSTTEHMSFHEATVIDFCQKDEVIQLELQDVLVNKAKCDVVLELSAVTNITIDGKASDTVSMETSDGEILSLELGKDTFSVIIEWHDFNNGRAFTKSYVIAGGRVVISVSRC